VAGYCYHLSMPVYTAVLQLNKLNPKCWQTVQDLHHVCRTIKHSLLGYKCLSLALGLALIRCYTVDHRDGMYRL